MPELKPQHFQAVLDALPPIVKVQMQLNPRQTYLAGGFIREVVIGNKPRDIDIFVPNENEAKRLSAEYAQEYANTKFKPWKSDYAYNFTPDGEFPVQWVFAVRYNPDESWQEHHFTVIDSFDFSMSKAVVWFENEDWRTFCNDNFYETVEKRQLIFEPSHLDDGNLRALKRALKFVSRGWAIDDENLTHIIQKFAPEKTYEQIREALYPLYGQKKQKKEQPAGWTEVVLDEFQSSPMDLNIWRAGTATGRVSVTGVQRNGEYLDLGNASSVEVRAERPLNSHFGIPYGTASYEWPATARVFNESIRSFDVETANGTNQTSGTAAQPTDNANNEQGQ